MNEVPSTAVGSLGPRQGYNRDRWITTPKCGGRGQLTGSTVTLYTAPTGSIAGATSQKARLTEILFANNDSVARTITLYLVESGGTANAARTVMPAVSIPANTTWRQEFNTPLESGETVQGKASTTAVITYRISVEELT